MWIFNAIKFVAVVLRKETEKVENKKLSGKKTRGERHLVARGKDE